MKALEPIQFPLVGERLIEASAGTGKTYTIAALYLRLVIGHGEENAHPQGPLSPDQILVVTFTKAATEELRDRIRRRLVEGAACFREEAQPDPFLAGLIATVPATEHAHCALLLEQAAAMMDLAAIHTIHSWCQRMLREHAFDALSLFDLELSADTSALTEEAARDYWRHHFYGLSASKLAQISEVIAEPIALLKAVRSIMGQSSLPKGDPLPVLTERERVVSEAKSQWRSHWPELRHWLEDALSDKKLKWINGSHLSAVDEWLESEQTLPRFTGKNHFTAEGLKAAAKKGVELPDFPILTVMAELQQSLQQLDLRKVLFCHAANWIVERTEQQKHRLAQLDFDDLIHQLARALKRDHSQGGRLGQIIVQQFPVAMIDEFQDTDAQQYALFKQLYSSAGDSTLLMIGDPKQAIYGFRGADIYAYLVARESTQGRHYGLDKNFRSTGSMVGAANALFAQAKQHQGGAFLHQERIPFVEVDANGLKTCLSHHGKRVPAITLWWGEDVGDVETKTDYLRRYAAACAQQIAGFLQGGEQKHTQFVGEESVGEESAGENASAFKSSDVAVLVRSYTEAEVVRQALSLKGIRSVYLSDKESIFDSAEAQDLLRILEAVANPQQERRVKAALGTSLIGLSWSQLDAFNQGDSLWDAQLASFRQLQSCWQQQGVLAMVRQLLVVFDVASRLLADAVMGERRLTNVLHLAELLQHAAGELDGELGMIRHLAEQISGIGHHSDEHILRLETDEALVKVVTIHKSKGLEYEVVFLPFVLGFREVRDEKGLLTYRGEDNRRTITFAADEQAKAAAEKERLAEDLRLLYVAITRAKHACYLGLGPLKCGKGGKRNQPDVHRSALGYLLSGGEAMSSAELESKLHQLAQHPDIVVDAPPALTDEVVTLSAGQFTLKPEPMYHRAPSKPWWTASYSSLLTGLGDHGLSAFSEQYQEAENEPLGDEGADESEPLPNTIHAFPRGALPGTFLHDLLEWAATQGQTPTGLPGFGAISEEALSSEIESRCERHGYTEHIEALIQWTTQALQVPLPAVEVSLEELEQVQAEMEFLIATQDVDVAELDELVQQAIWPGQARPRLSPNRLNGMLKGFIDLTFCHQGKYYVADYKSNYLGPNHVSYGEAPMRQAMLSHRYDLQAVLYVLALHRLLFSRLPDYDYQTHIGGGLYLFLRGMQLGAAESGMLSIQPPEELILKLDKLFRCAASDGSQG